MLLMLLILVFTFVFAGLIEKGGADRIYESGVRRLLVLGLLLGQRRGGSLHDHWYRLLLRRGLGLCLKRSPLLLEQILLLLLVLLSHLLLLLLPKHLLLVQCHRLGLDLLLLLLELIFLLRLHFVLLLLHHLHHLRELLHLVLLILLELLLLFVLQLLAVAHEIGEHFTDLCLDQRAQVALELRLNDLLYLLWLLGEGLVGTCGGFVWGAVRGLVLLLLVGGR